MKTVSKKELDRLRKRGGVKVKRHLGTKQKTPEPEVAASVPLSGSIPSKTPVPASAPELDLKPFASMAASMAVRDAHLEEVIANNTRVVENFRREVTELNKPRKRVPWDAFIHRDKKNLLINRIRLEPDESGLSK